VIGVPAHVPFWQLSLWVQALLSLHEAVLFVCTHPNTTSHVSVVQTLSGLSLHAVSFVGYLHVFGLPEQTLFVHGGPSPQSAMLLQGNPGVAAVGAIESRGAENFVCPCDELLTAVT
jgi:hypothetical protein